MIAGSSSVYEYADKGVFDDCDSGLNSTGDVIGT